MRKLISKSAYQKARQCPKIAWMATHMPEKASDAYLNKSLLGSGNEVGDLAMGMFGDFIEVEQTFDFTKMAGQTEALLRSELERASSGVETSSVCEATFVDDEGCMCMADIVRLRHDGKLVVTEVKSSTKVKPEHVQDAAFQAWVIERCGWKVDKVRVMCVDSSYVRHGELNLERYFKVEDVTEAVREAMPGIEGAVRAMREAAERDAEPDVAIGKMCNSPYPCVYQDWCWRHVPEKSVFDLAGVGRTRGIPYWEKGIRTYADAQGKLKANGFRDAQIRCEVEGVDEVADIEGLRGFLRKISWPVAHLDFETAQMAVPLWDGTKPYQQMTTQYSIHIQREPGGELEHREFLAPEEGDPRRALAEALARDVPEGACVTAYNASFEKGRLAELAEAVPELAGRMLGIRESIVDIMEPFQKGWLYRKEMGSSWSIKSVLPAFCPDDPELDYHALDGVHNGSEASATFLNLALMESEARARMRESLLRYCELDTLAMAKVLDAIIMAAGLGHAS